MFERGHGRVVSQLEARSVLQRMGRAQELDALLGHHLPKWADEVATQGLSLRHELRRREDGLWLDIQVKGSPELLQLSVLLDAIDSVFVLRGQTRSHYALSALDLLEILRDTLERHSASAPSDSLADH